MQQRRPRCLVHNRCSGISSRMHRGSVQLEKAQPVLPAQHGQEGHHGGRVLPVRPLPGDGRVRPQPVHQGVGAGRERELQLREWRGRKHRGRVFRPQVRGQLCGVFPDGEVSGVGGLAAR
uniref:(northern house mosquito) hypothetical protein n=1 Tax=Culex pipiens TaxID=7175 RepID=A0A8D8E812_CULPI